MSTAIPHTHSAFIDSFRQAMGHLRLDQMRIGAELKFPLVDGQGQPVPRETVDALWAYLAEAGWTPETDGPGGRVVGARTPGEENDTVASCETGYCKTEFSLAHVADLFAVEEEIKRLRELLRGFARREGVHFLAHGIIPAAEPGKNLLMKKERTSFWEQVFPSNAVIAREHGDDMHLFTINAASHVHVGLPETECVQAVNALNGFAGAIIALTAHSSVWRGGADPEGYLAVAELFWDRWQPAAGRVGVTPRAFESLLEYAEAVSALKPVYVKRDGEPLILRDYETFRDFYESGEAVAYRLDGASVTITPEATDLELHNSCYWYNTRVSRYYTVENRICDQQPPDALCVPSALTAGLAWALPEARDELANHEWEALRESRAAACRDGLKATVGALSLRSLSEKLVDIAEAGLRRRERGEEKFLAPLRERLASGRTPAEEAREIFETGGMKALIEARSL